MNKVTSYLKNVGKSITYATVKLGTKTLIPEVSEFTKTNDELFKAVYATVAHPKKSVRYGTNFVKRSQIYKDINTGIDNVFEDIKTGNFYNKTRSDASVEATGTALAFGDDDWGDDFDLSDWDSDDGSLDDFKDDEPSITKGDELVADVVMESGNLSSQLISKTVATTGNNSIKAGLANTKMMMSQNVELVAGIRTSIAGVHESINSILKISQEAIVPHFNTQSQFFTDSINIMKENNAILKEMREMQKNVYEKQMEDFKSKNQFSDVFSGGTLDLTEYAKAVWKNSKNYVDKTGMLGMLGSSMGGTSMLGQLLSNPLGAATMALVRSYIPKDFAKQIASFSKTLGNAFPAMIGRLNKWKQDDVGGIRGLLGNIFGLSSDNKTTIDTSKYDKGAVPFDGITRKAIVDVIPEHLSKIESILSGSSQRIYNFETGKWMTARDIAKAKENDYKYAVNSGFSSINDEIKTFMDALSVDIDSKRRFEKEVEQLKEDIFKGNELLSPENIIKEATDPLMKEFGVMLSKIPVSKLSEVYANIYDSKTTYSKKMANAESKGYSVINKLFDNSNIDSHLVYDKTFKDYVTGSKSNINLLNIKDKHGLNVLDYLKQILSNISFIREFGTGSNRPIGSGPNGGAYRNRRNDFYNSKKNSTSNNSFESYANSLFKEYTPEELTKLKQKQADDDERYNRYHYKKELDEEVTAWDARTKVEKKSKFSNLDEDEFKGFGKRYKEKNHWMKEMDQIPGDSFTQKWTNAQSMKQKQILIMGSLSDIARKPASMLTGLMAKAEQSVYNFLFKADTDMFDDEGKDIKGFFQATLHEMKTSWYDMTTRFDEKVISPLVKKYGLDEKWEKLKEKIKNTKPVEMLRNAKNNVKSALFKDLGGVYNYTKDAISDTIEPIAYNKAFTNIHENRINKMSNKIDNNTGNILNSLNNMSKENQAWAKYNMTGTQVAQLTQAKFKKIKEALKANDIETAKTYLKTLSSRELSYFKNKLAKTDPEFLEIIRNAGFSSGGIGTVTKTGDIPGIGTVSEGEEVIVVPNDEKKRERDKNREADVLMRKLVNTANSNDAFNAKISTTRSKIEKHKNDDGLVSDIIEGIADEASKGYKLIGKTVQGITGIKGDTEKEQDKNIEKEKKTLFNKASKIFGEMKGEGANTASKMIIGGGLGLLSGVFGGPLIGAGIGAATSIIKNSETVNKAIFGEDITDEEGNTTHKEGIISKNMQDTFKKYIPDMGKYGAVGAVASFLTPFGPLGGAAVGAGISLMKNSETMNKMIFGEEVTNEDGTKTKKGGLLTPERLGKIKKFVPKAALGALGGLVLGPFGLIGNAALGAGVGMLTGTEDFKDLILGEKDSKGDRIGGIKGAMKEHFIDPLTTFGNNLKNDFFDFIKESMIDPLNDAITPITREISFWAKKIGIGIPKFFLQIGRDYIAQPLLSKLEDYIGRPIKDGLKKVFGSLFSRAKGIISAPFRAIGAIGNATRRHQLNAGTDAGGLAKDRLAFAEKQHMDDYKYKGFDEKLAENSDNTEWLEELTARTGYLAHGSDYFKREVKKSRNELSKVVNDYYKLGWFKFDNNKSYKRIRKYISNNDIESAIAELSNITETRKGGKLDGEESNNAIARFASANKKYQATRSARDKLANINETENAAWMEEQFGENWRELKADRLFDYAKKESLAAGGRDVAKSDLFKDPTNLITKGDETINNTLREILDAITDAKKGVFHTEEENQAYDDAVKAGESKFHTKVDIEKDLIKFKFSEFGFKDSTINILYNNERLQKLVLAAKAKGTTYDDDTIAKLAVLKLSGAKYRLLKKYPNVAFMEPEDIEKNLDYTRNNHGTITNNRFFGAKKFRNENLRNFNDQFKQEVEDEQPEEANQNQSMDDLNDESSDNKVTYVSTNYGIKKFIKKLKGGWTPDNSDSETKEATAKEEEEVETRRGLMSHVGGLKDSIFGFFKRNKEKEDEEKKEPWYKKLFNTELGSKVKFGAAILGLLTTVGGLKSLWDSSKENNGLVYRIGSSVGEKVGPYITKLGNWFTNTGEYTDTANTGFQGFLNKNVFPNMFKGMNVIFGTLLPALVTVFIKNIPNLIKGALKGVASLFGWWDDTGSNGDLNVSKLSITNSNSANNTSGASWLSEVQADASAAADSINNITVDDSGNLNSNTTTIGGARRNESNDTTSTESSTSRRTGGARRNVANDIISDISTQTDTTPLEYYDEQMYIKDATGNFVAAVNDDYTNRRDLYNKEGTAHWVYDETQGEYVAADDSKTNNETPAGNIAKRLGYSGLRGFLTGKESLVGKIGKKLKIKNKASATGLFGNAIKGATKVFGGASSAGASTRKLVESRLQATSGKTAKASTKIVSEAAKADKKKISSIIESIKSFLHKLFKSESVVERTAEAAAGATTKKKTLGDLCVKVIEKITDAIGPKLREIGTTKLGKIAAKITSRGIMTGLFIATDFISGWDRAEAILTIKEPSAIQKLIAAIANALVNFAFAGFIETSWLINKLVDIVFPIFNIDVSEYKEDVANTKKEIDEYKDKEGDNKTYEQYLEENYSTGGKIKSNIKNFFGIDKSLKNTSNSSTTTSNRVSNRGRSRQSTQRNNRYGRGTGINKDTGFVSQLDNKYKNKKFNISGDTQRQTIGDSGCAPATAANVLNYFTGQGSVMDDASKAALRFKDKNGGVTPDYFNNYLGKQGIGTYSTMDKKELVSGIGQGKPTILLGSDPTNRANTPYGSSSSHYVLATGMDGRGNVIIQDPESNKPNILYPIKDVISQSQMGIITGRGSGKVRSITSKVRSKLGSIGFGRGHTAQYEDLAKWSPLSDSELDNFIKKTNSKSPFTGKSINAAAKASGLNPRYILAHAALESAWGTSNYGKKYHNYFGIGAFDSNPDNAINYGNNGMESGLIEGAKWIRQNYYDAGQTTVYTMRYNNGTHQYCTSDTWVDTIAAIMESMPANTSAEYHEMDNTVTGANANAAGDIFSQFSNAMLSYYDQDLLNIIFGTTSEDTGSLESNSVPGGVSASGTAQAVIEVASAEVGVKADSKQNTKYHDEYGMNNCPWCVIFLWWVFKHAGCPEQFYGGGKTASVPELLAYYRKNNQLVNKNDGQPGDIVFINFNGGSTAAHVGLIVANLGNGRYTTIEGNTDYGAGYSTGRVGKNDRSASCVISIARPNYATSSGSGTNKKFKSITHINPEIRYTGKGKNIAAAILSGKGTGKGVKYSTYSTGTTTASNVLNNSRKYYSSNMNSKSINTSLNGRDTTAKISNNSLPSLKSSYGANNYNTSRVSYLDANGGVSSTSNSGAERLLGVIIEILQIIANNSEKLSEIVGLLSKALNLELTDNDISGLSSNNAKIKNKIANALKSQGSANGLGSSSMTASTESLAAAMYSIARA